MLHIHAYVKLNI